MASRKGLHGWPLEVQLGALVGCGKGCIFAGLSSVLRFALAWSSPGQFRRATHLTLDIREMWLDDPYETIPGFKDDGDHEKKRGALARNCVIGNKQEKKEW